MKTIEKKLKEHLLGLKDKLQCFHKNEVQVEGWLKGEILVFLERLKANGDIKEFHRECILKNRKRADIVIEIKKNKHWVELKHWHIGKQKGKEWNIKDYIKDLEDDAIKLDVIPPTSRKWILVLCTKNPGKTDWYRELNTFNATKEFFHKLKPASAPTSYPDAFFLGLLRIDKKRESKRTHHV